MTLSKRERYIIAATLAVVLVFVLDRYVVTPLMDRRDQANAEKMEAVRQMQSAEALFSQRKRTAQRWQEMRSTGLRGDAAEAESALLRALQDWSRASGLTLSLLKPERPVQKGCLPQIVVHAVGGGTMENIVKFLWLVETAELPLKVEQMQLGSRKEGADDLSLQLQLSALYIPRERKAAAPAPATHAPAGGNP
jgi:Tfp pilus assembly protein PilO